MMKKPKKKSSSFRSKAGGVLTTELKGVGTALLSVLIAEIVEKTVEKLFQKLAPAEVRENGLGAPEPGSVESNLTPNTLTKLRGKLEQATPAVQETIGLVQSAVSQITPAVTEVVDVLKHATQPSKNLLEQFATEGNGVPILTTTKSNSKKRKKKGKKKKE